MKNKLIIIAVIIIVILIGFLFLKTKKPSYEFVSVERKNIEQIVSATGTITPSQKIDLQFEVSGKVKNIFVKVGDEVKAKQILIKLEDQDLQTQLRQQKAALEAAQAKLDLLKAGSSPEEIQLAETEVKNAETAVANAEKNLTDVREKAKNDLDFLYDGAINTLDDAYIKADDAIRKQIDDLFIDDELSNPKISFTTTDYFLEIKIRNNRYQASGELNNFKQEIETADFQDHSTVDSLLTKTKNHLAFLRDFLSDLMDLVNNITTLNSATVTTYKANITTARTNINTSFSNINTLTQNISSQKITNQININTAQSSLDTANSNLAKTKDQLTIKKAGSRPEDIRYQEAQIHQQEAALANIQEKIRKTILVAPINGVITAQEAEVGETILTTKTPISMNSLGNFEIELDISETEITKVSVGQSAKINLDALSEERFSGHVTKINPAETVIQGVVYYKATVSFDQQDERIKSGMTANVDIITAEKKNVLIIPQGSVVKKNGKSFVRILKDGKVEEKEIEVGLRGSQGEIEIISGLKEGEQIISFIKGK